MTIRESLMFTNRKKESRDVFSRDAVDADQDRWAIAPFDLRGGVLNSGVHFIVRYRGRYLQEIRVPIT